MDNVPRNRQLAIVNVKRKLKIWELAKAMTRPGGSALANIPKAYHQLHSEVNFNWQPPRMMGLATDWGDTDEETDNLMEDLLFFLSASPEAQHALLHVVDIRRRKNMRETLAELLSELRSEKHRWTSTIEQYILRHGSNMEENPVHYEEFIDATDDLLEEDDAQRDRNSESLRNRLWQRIARTVDLDTLENDETADRDC